MRGASATIVVYLTEYRQDAFAWRGKYSSGAGCDKYGGQQPFVGDFSRGGYPDAQMYLFDWQWADGVRQMSGDDNSISYSFTGSLRTGIQSTSPLVTATGTATATTGFLPEARFNHWELRDNQTDLTCNGSMLIRMYPMDGYDQPYAPVGISGSEAPVTVSLDDSGPYVFLRALGQEGTTVSTTLSDGCTLVFDADRGGFSGDTKVVTVTVTGDGKSGSFPVILHCNSDLDHFQVTATPTVLSQGMYSKLTVIAQDSRNHEVFFPQGPKFEVTLSLSSLTSFLWMRFWGPPPYGSLVVGDGAPQILSVQVPYDTARAGRVGYFVQDDILTSAKVDPMIVTIRAEKVGDASKNGVTQVEVVKPICVHVAFDASTVSVGESTALQFTKADGSGGFPADQKFVVLIESGEGALVSSTASGTILAGTSAPVHYMAPATIVGNSMVVRVRAFTYSSGAGTPAGSQVSTVPIPKGSTLKTISKAATTQSLGKKARDAQVAAIVKLLDESTCASAQVEVRKADLDHFLVTPSPDTIAHGETARITILAVDANGREVSLIGSTQITLGASPGEFGAVEPAQGVTYGIARNGGVTYVANGTNPSGVGAQRVNLSVSGLGKEGSAPIFVRKQCEEPINTCSPAQLQPQAFSAGNVRVFSEWDSFNGKDNAGKPLSVTVFGCGVNPKREDLTGRVGLTFIMPRIPIEGTPFFTPVNANSNVVSACLDQEAKRWIFKVDNVEIPIFMSYCPNRVDYSEFLGDGTDLGLLQAQIPNKDTYQKVIEDLKGYWMPGPYADQNKKRIPKYVFPVGILAHENFHFQKNFMALQREFNVAFADIFQINSAPLSQYACPVDAIEREGRQRVGKVLIDAWQAAESSRKGVSEEDDADNFAADTYKAIKDRIIAWAKTHSW